jgi:hypothetical protein
MEVTYRAHPQVTLQVASFTFLASSVAIFNSFFQVLTQNANKWAEEGWGGYLNFGIQDRTLISIIYFNPNLSQADAMDSMAPVYSFLQSNPSIVVSSEVSTYNSYYEAYREFIFPNEEAADIGAAISSRLIPKALLSTKVVFHSSKLSYCPEDLLTRL